jgi:uncharacterized repeat protein (TIGR01451 family)
MKLRSFSQLARSAALLLLIAVVAVLAANTAAWARPSQGPLLAASSTVPKKQADMSITKSAKEVKGTPNTFDFTLTVKNKGPLATSGVVATDYLPSHLALVSVTTTQGSCSGTTTITCSIGNMALNQVVTIKIRASITPLGFKGTVTNTATVTSSFYDQNMGNNSASANVTGH